MFWKEALEEDKDKGKKRLGGERPAQRIMREQEEKRKREEAKRRAYWEAQNDQDLMVQAAADASDFIKANEPTNWKDVVDNVGYSLPKKFVDLPKDKKTPSLGEQVKEIAKLPIEAFQRWRLDLGESIAGAYGTMRDYPHTQFTTMMRMFTPDLWKQVQSLPVEKQEELYAKTYGKLEPLMRSTDKEDQFLRTWVDETRSRIEKYHPVSEATKQAEADGTWWRSPHWWAEVFPNVIGEFGITAGLGMVNPVLGAAYAAGRQGGSVAADRYQAIYERTGNRTLARQMATTQAVPSGAITAATSMLPIKFIRGELGSASKSGAARLLGAGAVESAQEMVEGGATDLLQYGVEHDPTALQGFWGRRAKEGLPAFFSGAGVKGITGNKRTLPISEERAASLGVAIANAQMKEGGEQRLLDLAKKEKPTRRDIKEAGVDIKTNATEREFISRILTKKPEAEAVVEQVPVADTPPLPERFVQTPDVTSSGFRVDEATVVREPKLKSIKKLQGRDSRPKPDPKKIIKVEPADPPPEILDVVDARTTRGSELPLKQRWHMAGDFNAPEESVTGIFTDNADGEHVYADPVRNRVGKENTRLTYFIPNPNAKVLDLKGFQEDKGSVVPEGVYYQSAGLAAYMQLGGKKARDINSQIADMAPADGAKALMRAYPEVDWDAFFRARQQAIQSSAPELRSELEEDMVNPEEIGQYYEAVGAHLARKYGYDIIDADTNTVLLTGNAVSEFKRAKPWEYGENEVLWSQSGFADSGNVNYNEKFGVKPPSDEAILANEYAKEGSSQTSNLLLGEGAYQVEGLPSTSPMGFLTGPPDKPTTASDYAGIDNQQFVSDSVSRPQYLTNDERSVYQYFELKDSVNTLRIDGEVQDEIGLATAVIARLEGEGVADELDRLAQNYIEDEGSNPAGKLNEFLRENFPDIDWPKVSSSVARLTRQAGLPNGDRGARAIVTIGTVAADLARKAGYDVIYSDNIQSILTNKAIKRSRIRRGPKDVPAEGEDLRSFMSWSKGRNIDFRTAVRKAHDLNQMVTQLRNQKGELEKQLAKEGKLTGAFIDGKEYSMPELAEYFRGKVLDAAKRQLKHANESMQMVLNEIEEDKKTGVFSSFAQETLSTIKEEIAEHEAQIEEYSNYTQEELVNQENFPYVMERAGAVFTHPLLKEIQQKIGDLNHELKMAQYRMQSAPRAEKVIDKMSEKEGELSLEVEQILKKSRDFLASSYYKPDEIARLVEDGKIDVTLEQLKATAIPPADDVGAKPSVLPSVVTAADGYIKIGKLNGRPVLDQLLGNSLVAKKMKRLGKRVLSNITKSGGALPDGAFNATLERQFEISGIMREAQFAVDDLRDAMKAVYGVDYFGDMPVEVANQLSAALHDRSQIKDLPEQMQDPAYRLRGLQDKLSRRLTEEGVIEGDLELDLGAVAGYLAGQKLVKSELYQNIRDSIRAGTTDWQQAVDELVAVGIPELKAKTLVTVLQNDGLYIHTTYKAFRDPDYADMLDPKIKKNFIAWMRGEKAFQGMSDNQLESEVQDILYSAQGSNSLFQVLSRMKGVEKHLGALKKKKNLPAVWKALLGEDTDPVGKIVNSIFNTAHMVETHAMLGKIVEDGTKNRYLFTDEDPNRSPTSVRIRPDMSASLKPLGGMWAEPELIRALRDFAQPKQRNPYYQALLHVENFSQKAKTIWSPMAMIRQLPSNMINAIANGLNPLDWVTSAREVATEFVNMKDADLRTQVIKYVRLGLFGEQVDVNAIADRANVDMLSKITDELASPSRGKFLRNLKNAPASLYQSMDVVFKVAAFKREFARYRRALPTEGPDAVPDQDIERRVAKIVRDTHPTYSMIAPMFQQLKRAPIGNFISFQTEVLRNLIMREKLIVQELQDPNLRSIGIKRQTGQFIAAAMPTAFATAMRMMLSEKIDDEDEEALRQHDAPWAENSTVMHFGGDGKGRFMNIDLGYINPFGFGIEAANAVRRGETFRDKVVGGMAAILEPYISPKLATKAALEVIFNKKSGGGKIYNEHDTDEAKFDMMAEHFARSVEPGAIRSAIKVVDAFQSGDTSKLVSELTANLLGARLRYTDIDRSLHYDALDFKRNEPEISAIFTTAARDKDASDNEVWESYVRTNVARKKEFDRLHTKTVAAERLMRRKDAGVENYNPGETLRGAGISAEKVDAIMLGEFTPYMPSQLPQIERLIKASQDPELTKVLKAKRSEKLDNLVYQATSPGYGDGGQRVMDAQKMIEERKIPKVEQGERLLREFKEKEIASRIGSIKQKLPPELRAKERVIRLLAIKQVNERKFEWTDSRKERLGRLYLSEEELKQVLSQAGERYVP